MPLPVTAGVIALLCCCLTLALILLWSASCCSSLLLLPLSASLSLSASCCSSLLLLLLSASLSLSAFCCSSLLLLPLSASLSLSASCCSSLLLLLLSASLSLSFSHYNIEEPAFCGLLRNWRSFIACSVAREKHGVLFPKGGNSCGPFLGPSDSSSVYPLMTLSIRRPVIIRSFTWIARTHAAGEVLIYSVGRTDGRSNKHINI